MESVGCIKYLRSLLPSFLGGEARDDSSHRRIAMDHIIATLRNNTLQQSVRLQIIAAFGRTRERDIKNLICKIQLQPVFLNQIVPSRHVNLPSMFMEKISKQAMKLTNMTLYGSN